MERYHGKEFDHLNQLNQDVYESFTKLFFSEMNSPSHNAIALFPKGSELYRTHENAIGTLQFKLNERMSGVQIDISPDLDALHWEFYFDTLPVCNQINITCYEQTNEFKVSAHDGDDEVNLSYDDRNGLYLLFRQSFSFECIKI